MPAAKPRSLKQKSAKKSVSRKTASKKRAVKKIATTNKVAKRPVVKKAAAKKASPKKSAQSASKPSKVSASKVVLKSGDIAPAFSRLNQDGKSVSLSDFMGKQHVVLYFYPRAMTPGCTVQACGIRDTAAEFKNVNAVVLGVSPDKVASLVKFCQRDKLNFDLLSDEDKTLADSYGVLGKKKFMGREFIGVRRWTFIIGKDGKIKHMIHDVNTKTHHDDVLALLKAL